MMEKSSPYNPQYPSSDNTEEDWDKLSNSESVSDRN